MAILTAPRRTAQLALILFLVIVRLGAAHAPTYVSAPTGDALSREKLLRGSSPRPTTAPGRPRFGAVELFRREYSDDRTCGLIATEGVYFRCPTGYKCTNIGTVQDCCHKTRGEAACTSQLWTTCFGYSAFISGECDILSPHTLCW